MATQLSDGAWRGAAHTMECVRGHDIVMMQTEVIHIPDIEAVETPMSPWTVHAALGRTRLSLRESRGHTRPKARRLAGYVRRDNMGLCAGGTRRAGGKDGTEY